MATEIPSTPVANYAAVEDVKGDEHLINSNATKSSRSDGYKPIFLGQSAFDLWFIPICLIGLWGGAGLYFTLLLHSTVKTSSSDAALWFFFVAFMLLSSAAAVFVNVKDVNAKSTSRDIEA